MNRGLAARFGQRRQTDSDQLLPLINVVFLVLVFLMMSAILVTPAPFDIEPVQGAGSPTGQSAPARVAVSAQGELAWAGERLGEDALIRELTRHAEAGVLLNADAEADANTVMALARRLEAADLGPVRLLLSEPRPD